MWQEWPANLPARTPPPPEASVDTTPVEQPAVLPETNAIEGVPPPVEEPPVEQPPSEETAPPPEQPQT